MEKALQRIQSMKRPKLERKKAAFEFSVNKRSGQDVAVIKGLSKSIEGRSILSNLELQIRYGEKVALVGKNGSGKTTLLETIQTLDHSNGYIKLGPSVSIGYLSQRGLTADSTGTVLDIFRERVPMEEGEARHHLAKFLFYGASVYRKGNELSGGEQQRVAVARALMNKPDIVFADEPTGNLDSANAKDLHDLFFHLRDNFNQTFLIVTHNEELAELSDRVLHMKDGKIIHAN